MDFTEGDADSIEFPVAADEWQDYVDAFKEQLKQTPNPAGPPTAVFQVKGGKKLRVTKLDQVALAPDSTTYSSVADKTFVDIIYESLPSKNQGKRPYDINIIATRGNEPAPYTIRLAETKFQKEGFVERTGGVIHNPPSIAR